MDRFSKGRRRALAAALVVAAAPFGMARAQDPRTSAAQAEALAWLALADRLDASGTWKAAGAMLKQRNPPTAWARSLKSQREPLGTLVTRTISGTRFLASPAGLPPGDYVLVRFRSTFSKVPMTGETLTLEREADGAWRVIRYVIG